MRFAHIADTHIRNLKYHFEYREVFKQLYKSLKEEKVDLMSRLKRYSKMSFFSKKTEKKKKKVAKKSQQKVAKKSQQKVATI